jgi:hypothetical protein
MPKKKQVLSFEEFLEEKKAEQNKPGFKMPDGDLKKEKWLDSIEDLYLKVDKLIVDKFKKVGYTVTTEREETKITEDFIGSYITYNYIIKANKYKVRFCPICCIMTQYNGRVDMLLPRGSVKLILNEENKWKIAERFSFPMTLIELNEKNIQKIFEDFL